MAATVAASRRRPLRTADLRPIAVQLEGVSKCYRRGGETVHVLDRADLVVRAGELVAMVGPSGSGKSTLLHLAGGLADPDEGQVTVDDRDLAGLNARQRAELRRRHIGFVFQFFHLLPTLSVAENVALPLVLGRRRDEQAVTAMLDAVGLSHRRDHLPSELSGGEMQRAAVARALVTKPALVLADEPTGNLDSVTGAAVLDLLTSAVRDAGAALLLVTHDQRVAARADRTVALQDGRLS